MMFLSPSERTRALAVVAKVLAEPTRDASGADDDLTLLDAFARACWSGIGEPGDRTVNLLCDGLGAYSALEAITSGVSAAELARQMQHANHDDLASVSEVHAELSEVFASLVEILDEALTRWRPRLSIVEGIAHCERAARIGAQLVTPAHEMWPPGLERLGLHSPPALWVRGNVSLLSTLDRSVSVVGARASTGYGEHVTMDVVSSLCERGVTIVSGAAYGIDGMAHRAALAGDGATIAVLAGGIDRLYPSGHDALLRRIIEQGLVVTELPCGFAPTKWRFLQRNRIIAAMTRATVVVEAGWRSGSLNTAHHALDMDIPVGAVPGPVTSASSAGCHRLLRETPAVCVTTVDEVVQLALGDVSPQLQPEFSHPHAVRVLDSLSRRSARPTDEIAKLSGLSGMSVMAALGMLELEGAVRQNESGWLRA